MRNQWRDDDHRSYRDRRSYEYDRRARESTPTRHGEDRNSGSKIERRAGADEPQPSSSRASRHHDRTPRTKPVEARVDSPKQSVRGEGSRKSREIDEEKSVRRSWQRGDSPSSHHAKKHRSTTPERRRRHTEHERRRERSPRQSTRDASPNRRYRDRQYSPYSPHRDHHYSSSRDIHSSRKDRYPEASHTSSTRRGRSRSPVTLDHYRPETSRRGSRSPDRTSRRHEEARHKNREHSRESPPRERNRSGHSTARTRHSRPATPEKVSKSSRRSEKQKQRTLKHLRAKTRADQFLRAFSVSPEPRDKRREDRRMQNSTRPIQSILDEPSRQPSPPRPIPSFDDRDSGTETHLREQFPLHGMKATGFHHDHRRAPQHIDTRQQYGTPPQYMTPTSSHHGSPHSGSPYSQGRGGWGGQPHHYLGQPQYVSVVHLQYDTNQIV